MEETQQAFLRALALQAKKALGDYEARRELDVLWNGDPGYDSILTDVVIEELPQFGGITQQEVADAIYALKQLNVQIDSVNFAALVDLAARSSG